MRLLGSRAARVWVTAGVVVALALLGPSGFVAAARDVLGRSSGLLLVLGGVLLLVWAQLLGQPLVWRALCERIAPGRRLVEESLELAGYLCVLLAVLEEHWGTRSRTLAREPPGR